MILHLVDVSSLSGRDPIEDYEIINRELANYNPELAERPQIVVATKMDAVDEPERVAKLAERARSDGKAYFEISSVTNMGLKVLVSAIARRLDEETQNAREAAAATANPS